MDPSEPFSALESRITSALVASTRITSQLCAEDIPFHRSLDPSIGTQIDRQNERLLALADRLLSSAATGSDAVGHRDNHKSLLPDADALESNWRGVVDVLDSLLERADTSLDEFTGVVKRGVGTPLKEQSPTPPTRFSKNLFRTQDSLPKPQTLFEHAPRNLDTTAFKPILTYKPNALLSLPESINPFRDDGGALQYQHPYRTEIEQYKYPQRIYTKADPIPYLPFETTTATLVDTPEALEAMLTELKAAKEIAIDLEHHDSRSYIGIVSLMQISTRDKDWIVDTLKPWRRRLECLNEVFTDPDIVKVLHGAFMDIVWLQRDLGLYIVGLFDTHHAARSMGYGGGSLAFLLQKFINFSAQKQYQMADWRIRPLPKELFEYARADTHFLLYIFDNMRNEMIDRSNFNDPEQNLFHIVQEKSKEECIQRYETPIYDALRGLGTGGWYKLLAKTPVLLSREQFSVFRAVHQWRDSVAREEDESTTYVMPQHILFNIARTMPTDKAALFGVAQPMSQTFRLRADELVAVITKAKVAGANGPEMAELFSKPTPERDAGFGSVAAFRPQVTPGPTVGSLTSEPLRKAALIDTPSVRSQLSSFWGGALSSHVQKRSLVTDRVRLCLALPQLTAQVFVDPKQTSGLPGATTATPAFTPAAKEVSEEDEQDDVFIIKQLAGRKRKATAADEGITLNADEVAVADPEAQSAKERAARKAERRAARKQRKEQARLEGGAKANGASVAASDATSEAPLDYDNAPSILNAPRHKPDKGRRRQQQQQQQQPFDPFTKAMDTPKGLGRGQKERVGRSGTFKS